MKRGSYREPDYAFGQIILTLRSAIGLTQAELGNRLGVSRQAVIDWEAGNKYPKDKHLQNFIVLAVQHHAFTTGREADEIKALWQASHQKMMLDEVWLSNLLPTAASTNRARFHWEDALAVDAFYGREWELDLLQTWVIKERCRVVTLLGLGGVGKSVLAVKLMHQLAHHFEVVIWRSLRDMPTGDVLLADLLQVLIPQALEHMNDTFEQRLQLLMEHLRTNRVLLVLDNVESILEETEITGQMRPGYENFGHLLRQSAEIQHQSSILLTSRQKPYDLMPYEGNQSPVRTLRLNALDIAACEQLLIDRDVLGSPTERARLIEAYAGNPLALKIVTQTLVDLFGGEIAPFLEQGGMIFGGVRELLHQQYRRLTPLEQRIVFWLAIMREPITFNRLQTLFTVPLPPAQALETMGRLYRHSLIERGQAAGSFTLQSVVLEYLTEQLITEASEEIQRGELVVLLQHGLEQAQVKDYVRETQTRLLVAPLLLRLQSMAVANIEILLDKLREKPLDAQGYGPANLVALLRVQRGNLRGVDLSQLALRGVYLQAVEMQDARLMGSLIRDTTFTETFDGIMSLAISGTGDYWATASFNGQVRVWQAEGRTLYRLWRMDNEAVGRIAISPDGQWLACGCWDNTIKLLDVASGGLIWSLQRDARLIHLAFSPDGNIVVSVGEDSVRFWDRTSGELLETLVHDPLVAVFAWRKHGTFAATGDYAGTIRIWAIQKGSPAAVLRTIAGHEQIIAGMAFSPAGDRLASGSFDGTVKIWNTADGRLLETLTGHRDHVYRLVWSADGRVIASSGRDNIIWLWDVEQRRYRAALRGHTALIGGLAFTPDSRNLVSGSQDGTMRVWDVETGSCTRLIHGYTAMLQTLSWSPDSQRIVSVGSELILTLYTLNNAAPPRILRGHNDFVNDVGWSPDGRFIASDAFENQIRLWDVHTGTALESLRFDSDPDNYFTGLAWSPDSLRLAAGTSHHGVQVFDMLTRSARSFGDNTPMDIMKISWSPDGNRLASVGADGAVYLWEAQSGVLLNRLAEPETVIWYLAWSADSTRLATIGTRLSGGGSVSIWEVNSGMFTPITSAYPGLIYSVEWGADDAFLVMGSGDGGLYWWDVQTGAYGLQIEVHEGKINSVKVSPDRTMLASCGADGVVVICDVRTGERLQTLRRDRPYERLDITGITGLTEAQKVTLLQLGAIEQLK